MAEKFTVARIRQSIDYTLLKPNASAKDIDEFFRRTRKFGFERVFVSPFVVPLARQELEGVKIGTTAGFPLGTATTSMKVAEAEDALANGAEEVDFVLNIGKAIDRDMDYLEREFAVMAEVKQSTGGRLNLKVILETCFLSPELMADVVELAVEHGLDYVKTSTGFGPKGATVEDIRLLSRLAAGRIKVKASGGIQTLQQTMELIKAGADRIGTSRGDSIMEEAIALLPD